MMTSLKITFLDLINPITNYSYTFYNSYYSWGITFIYIIAADGREGNLPVRLFPRLYNVSAERMKVIENAIKRLGAEMSNISLQ